jgi:hypothetical protein
VEVLLRRSLPWLRYRPTRHLTRIPCQLVREHDFRLVGDQIVNLSMSGLLVTPTDPILTGQRLLISFRVPSGLGFVDAEVTVTRVVHGRRPSETARALGLEFELIEPGLRRMIQRELSWLPMVPPAWRPGRRATELATRKLVSGSSRPGAEFD